MQKIMRVFDASSVGYAIYLVMSSTSAWGLLSLLSMASQPIGVGSIETLRSIGYIGVLMLFGFGCLYLPAQFKSDTTYYSTACYLIGFAGLLVWAVSGAPVRLAELSALLVGAGSSLSFIMWQRVFAEQPPAVATRQIIVGSALSAALYLAITFIGNIYAYALAIVACVALNALFLRRCRSGLFDADNAAASGVHEVVVNPEKGPLLANIISSTWRYMLCIAAIGYVSGIARMLAQQGTSNMVLLNLTLAAGMLVAVFVLGALWRTVWARLSFRVVYAVLFFAVLTGFLFLPFFDGTYRIAFAGLANGAFSVASILMIITCLKVAHLRQIDPIAVFGIFSSIVYGGVLVGRAVGDAFGQTVDFAQLLVVALMSTYVLSFAGVIINARSRKGARGGDDFDPIDDASGEEGRDGAGADASACAGAAEGANEARPALGGTEGKGAGSPGGAAPSMPPLVRNVIVAQDMVPVYCRLMKKAYALSNRETDVLELIIRGRDVARMAETLFVSENTVRSHCKNLYRKLDVHNRQQVYDLVEEFRKREEYDVVAHPSA